MEQVFRERITTEEQLEALLPVLGGAPSQLVRDKVIHALDAHGKAFIAKAPFVAVATADAEGHCDVSPRGDAPGFVHVLDDRHLFIPERPGNRRMDTIHNIIANPYIGLIFIIPGLEETFRVNGKAVVTRDPELLKLTAVNGREPLIGIGVEVEECYMHCAKAFKRSGLWKPDSWLPEGDRPSPAQIIAAHVKGKMELTTDEVDQMLQESYTKRLY
ncbi:pyridoxamine 5'-phosphate oxidase family protein [Paenibacillus elgii]